MVLATLFLLLVPARAATPTADVDTTINGSRKEDQRWKDALRTSVAIITAANNDLAATGLSAAKAKELRAKRDRELARLDATGREGDENFLIQVYLARAFLSLSQTRRALDCADRAVALAPEDRDARLARGLARLKLGDKTRAAQDARRVLAKDPEDPDARDLLRRAKKR